MKSFVARTARVVDRIWTSTKELFEYLLLQILIAGPIPGHVAVIMDGNRRFAQKRGMEKKAGHGFGAETLARTVKFFYDIGVKYVTVYAFSVENFGRPAEEVETLMELMRSRLLNIAEHGDFAGLLGVRVRLLGNLKLLPPHVFEAASRAMEATAGNDRLILNICVAYSSSDEIVNAVRKCCENRVQKLGFGEEDICVASIGENVYTGLGEDDICVASIEENLYTEGCPEPDLLIRTSGETRLCALFWPIVE
eukprot:TRINITY_DN5325_c0_g1_i1.p1 TRINITY_DN5325_c0_g1~~TRINITY_DN5325_c0_g1_i1.p1  ORF type:complete len:252 (+),score=6.66 TRINITY_DN5325_c0_g1_i1:79-834(+)